MTDSTPDAESPSPPRRGLWAVMGQTASPEETGVGESSVAPANDSLPVEAEPAPTLDEPDHADAKDQESIFPSASQGQSQFKNRVGDYRAQ